MLLSNPTASLLALSFFVQAACSLPSSNDGTSPPRSQTCVIPSQYQSSQGTADDTPAIARAFAQCATDATIIFQHGVDYNLFSPLSATNLSNVEIRMHGNLHLPQDIPTVQAIVKNGTTTWITLKGPRVDWTGSPDLTTSWINSYGQAWWDANPPNTTGLANRPHLISYTTDHASISYFRSRKPIAWNMKLHGSDITVHSAIVDASSSSPSSSFPFNTDGFDIEGTHISITNSELHNGDDAIAIGTNSHDILFAHNTIGHQTHGMSIGSLGKDPSTPANISNLLFTNITVQGGLYAARFKSWSGGTGLVRNVTWQNIHIHNVSFPIFVTQSYMDQNADRPPPPDPSSAVTMEDFTWADFTGDINTFHPGDGSCVTHPCWYDVGLPNLNHTEAAIIQCHTDSSCRNFVTENIHLVPQSGEPAAVVCVNATEGLNPDLGFECRNGTFVSMSV